MMDLVELFSRVPHVQDFILIQLDLPDFWSLRLVSRCWKKLVDSALASTKIGPQARARFLEEQWNNWRTAENQQQEEDIGIMAGRSYL